MCDHSPNREAAMVVMQDGVWCDPCLVPLVKALNDGGLPTVASCCGHGKRPGKVALADGRELFLLPNFEAARRADDLLADSMGTGCTIRTDYGPPFEIERGMVLRPGVSEGGERDE